MALKPTRPMIKTAVIMAAGKGSRFGDRTSEMPKGFIEFNGKSMIERSIENLIKSNITKIIIGTGYHREWYDRLMDKYPQIVTVFSPEYAHSNSMETLYVCREIIGKDSFILLESDIVYEPTALTSLIDDPHSDIMLASDVIKFQDQYYIAVDNECNLLGCSTDKDLMISKFKTEPYGELVGIHKISNKFYQSMVKNYRSMRDKHLTRGYEYEIVDVATNTLNPLENKLTPNLKLNAKTERIPVFVLKPNHLKWYEIDDENDLKYAQEHIKI